MATAHGTLPRRNDGVRLNTFGSTGGGCIDLSDAASPSFGAARSYGLKTCELCGKNFLKLIVSTMRDCKECVDRQAKQRGEMAVVPPADGPEEEYGMKYENRRLAKAAHALSMRPVA